VHRISSANVIPIALWAITGFAAWYLTAQYYERFLGTLAWDFFPQKDTVLSLNDHVFSIGLRFADETTTPHLKLISHNFGFGLVITGAIILGTRVRSWAMRLIGLFCAWLILLLTQTGLLVAAAHTYQIALTQSEVPLVFSVFINAVHPIVTIMPIVIIVLWLLIPIENRLSGKMNISRTSTSASV